MHKTLLLLIVLLCTSVAFAQRGVLIVKKGETTVTRYYEGAFLQFYHPGGGLVQGWIRKNKNDSIHLMLGYMGLVKAGMGTKIDTVRQGFDVFSIKDVAAIPKDARFTSIWKSLGSLLQLGAAAYGGINLLNSITRGIPLFSDGNGTRLGITAGVFVVGLVLQKLEKDRMVMGKKYRVEMLEL
ncbi:MAG: hypothetical protein K2Y12_11630 [Chitinophagaceae bacterium]|nr:hypothetical protein [Chitinophagaceae bacterium]